MTTLGLGGYLYHIGPANGGEDLRTPGVSGGKVRRVAHGSLFAAMSDCPVARLPIQREHLMTHQEVMQEGMEEAAILPVRFGTIAEARDGMSADERVVEKLLKPRHEELGGLLEAMKDKVELGLKALWTDMGSVFRELVEEDPEIRGLRAAAMRSAGRQAGVALGRAVQEALLAKKEAAKDHLLLALRPLVADIRVDRNFGDRMFLNASFLVERRGAEAFREAAAGLSQELRDRTRLSCVGPVPVSSFVEIVVAWD